MEPNISAGDTSSVDDLYPGKYDPSFLDYDNDTFQGTGQEIRAQSSPLPRYGTSRRVAKKDVQPLGL
jgi:hypothetical protein